VRNEQVNEFEENSCTIDDIKIEIMRYCKIYDPIKLGRITLKQYFLMIKAIRLQLIDKERDLHAQAWLNVQAKATKQRGKKTVPYFKTFNEFFKHPDEKKTSKKTNAENNRKYDEVKQMLLKANMVKSINNI